MISLSVYGLLRKRALVTRQSARVIGEALATALAEERSEVVLDFSGIDAVTPSFVDEALSLAEETLRAGMQDRLRLVFLNPPTRLSAKFAAVGRARGLDMIESESGAWIISTGLAPENR